MKPLAHFRDFAQPKQKDGTPDGWKTWSPRGGIAPHFGMDAASGRHGRGALLIEGNGNPAAWGAWQRRVDGVIGGRTYHFTAFYRATGVTHPQRSIVARLDWLDENGRRLRPPDHVLSTSKQNATGKQESAGKRDARTKMEHIAPAPEGAHSLVIALVFGWEAMGAVRWDEIRLEEEPSPPGRIVRAATIHHRPQNTGSAAQSVAEFCRLIEQAGAQRPDIICLPEGITVIGTGKSYATVSETIPGPTTRKLGALARKLKCYIVAGVYERAGAIIYNTAVLLGRDGELIGAYRKTHLPREEVEAGISPGDGYPVFETDFGTVGIMICWDLQFPEAARALALRGAELILLPIWGGSEILARARAIENHVFLVSASYDMKSFVLDPTGKTLAEATTGNPVAVAELNLDRKIVQPWLGDMKTRTWQERRPDLLVDEHLKQLKRR